MKLLQHLNKNNNVQLEERPKEDFRALAVVTCIQKRARIEKDTIKSQEKTHQDAIRSQEDTQENFTKTQGEGRENTSQTQ